jgi:cholesterol oxidase
VLRDIAQEMQGELRTNPSWTVGKRPVTVHAQGGAGMGELGASVTDVSGRVWGHRADEKLNLYVMDAAAFPSSVGVNPSLTIAAVAEHKMDAFVREVMQVPLAADVPFAQQVEPKLAELPLAEHQQRVLERGPEKEPATLDGQLRSWQTRPKDGKPTQHLPVGMYWREWMEGSFWYLAAGAPEPHAHYSAGAPAPPLHEHHPTHGHVPINARSCTAAEKIGRNQGTRVSLELDCEVEDVERFYLEQWPTVRVKGSCELRGRNLPLSGKLGVSGELWLGFEGQHMRSMNYQLELTNEAGPVAQLTGRKFLTDDPGLDSFLDLTTLFVRIQLSAGGEYRGIVRVPLVTFLSKQLPTFALTRAEGMDDMAKLWGSARFFEFLFGSVKETYLPELFVQKAARRP